ncbi:MAG TPA: hypothetical protein VGK32_17930 [Vicinamibacterales bacterium]|jgi:tetratricopeptide (TPR) repeat protein
MPDQSKLRVQQVDRFMRLIRRQDETWQGDVVGLPFFDDDPASGEPRREYSAIWVNASTQVAALSTTVGTGPGGWSDALKAFLDLGLKSRKERDGRPARIEVRDGALGAFIKESIGDPELEVAIVPDVPLVREEASALVRGAIEGSIPPSAMEAPGVNLDRMRAFAEAARDFYLRGLAEELTDQDLIQVEAPDAPHGLKCCVVRPDGETLNVDFYATRDEFEEDEEDEEEEEEEDDDHHHAGREEDEEDDDEEEEDDEKVDGDDDEDEEEVDAEDDEVLTGEDGIEWTLTFGAAPDLPPFDVALWLDRDLPVAGPAAYPSIVGWMGPAHYDRPDGGQLAFLEGLLRALGATTEAEIDSGRWTRKVLTAEGEVTYRLSLASIVGDGDATGPEATAEREEQERVGGCLSRILAEGGFSDLDEAAESLRAAVKAGRFEAPPATTPLERAQELAYRAHGAPGRRQLQLVRDALRLSPDCADAYLTLAERQREPERGLPLFNQATEAVERILGSEELKRRKGHFWDSPQTRTYLRARFGAAAALRALDRVPDAIAEYRRLIELDTDDHAGAGYYLLAVLLETGRDQEAVELLDEYEDDGPEWAYGHVLWMFRNRPVSAAHEALKEALASHPVVALLLSEPEDADPDDGEQTDPLRGLASEDDEIEEALDCLTLFRRAWELTPGAVEWLRAELDRRHRSRRGRSGRRGHRVH